MKYIYLLLLLFAFTGYSQYKDGISVVQFSAEFLKDKEISLKQFDNHNCYTYYLSKHGKYFKKEAIIYGGQGLRPIPTLLEPVLLLYIAFLPIAIFSAPVVLFTKAL